jgi:hypothetical protein
MIDGCVIGNEIENQFQTVLVKPATELCQGLVSPEPRRNVVARNGVRRTNNFALR